MKEINRMGAGWFIVKLAIEQGILNNTNMPISPSNPTKEYTYKKTKNQHFQFIDYLVNNWNNRIALLGSNFTNKDLKELAIKLQKNVLPQILNPQIINKTIPVSKGNIWNEFDEDKGMIRYDKSVPINQRVSGLASFLYEVYFSITRYAQDLLYTLFDKEGINFEFNKIPVILKQGHPRSTYKTDDKTLAKIICDYQRKKERIASVEELISILSKKTLTMNVVGEYCGEYIVLYYENTCASTRQDLFDELEMTLAHEYMHYVHNMYVGNKTFYSKTKNRNNVIEPIADFYSAMYMAWCAKKIQLAQKRLDFWIEYYGYSIPYVYSLNFLVTYSLNYINNYQGKRLIFPSSVDHYSVDKFLEVFDISKKSIEDAFDFLTK